MIGEKMTEEIFLLLREMETPGKRRVPRTLNEETHSPDKSKKRKNFEIKIFFHTLYLIHLLFSFECMNKQFILKNCLQFYTCE